MKPQKLPPWSMSLKKIDLKFSSRIYCYQVGAFIPSSLKEKGTWFFPEMHVVFCVQFFACTHSSKQNRYTDTLTGILQHIELIYFIIVGWVDFNCFRLSWVLNLASCNCPYFAKESSNYFLTFKTFIFKYWLLYIYFLFKRQSWY